MILIVKILICISAKFDDTALLPNGGSSNLGVVCVERTEANSPCFICFKRSFHEKLSDDLYLWKVKINSNLLSLMVS